MLSDHALLALSLMLSLFLFHYSYVDPPRVHYQNLYGVL